ncbi:MAG: glucose-6-phosphate isomerase family protein [Actinomycetes bacterium]
MVDKVQISRPKYLTNWQTGAVSGSDVVVSERRIADLTGVFADEAAFAATPADRLVYRTECVFPVAAGTEGGLFWGTTFIEPGTVGDEYFMTKGHIHAKADRTEFYFTYAGTGLLLMMDADRNCWAEEMTAGSTHAIPANTAHRTVNLGDDVLSFGACWPSDAGHDYRSIADAGFSARVRLVGEAVELVPV